MRGAQALNEIEKELNACDLCCQGYHKGIPIAQLSVMHRPVSEEQVPTSARPSDFSTGSTSRPVEHGGNAPRDGASYPAWFPEAHAKAVAADRAVSTSPRERPDGPLAQALRERGSKKLDDVLNKQEERGRKYANRKKGPKSKAGKQAGGKVPKSVGVSTTRTV